jgi:hypothetical protein
VKQPIHRLLFLVLVVVFLASSAALAQAPASQREGSAGLDTARIEQLTGAKGALDAKEGVFKVSVPRKDLAVRVGGAKLNPRLGLTSWAAFQRAGEGTMVMGDIVVLEGEVDPVMSAALDAGLEVTALHNHFLWDEPRVMFMHIGGHGPADDLATAVGKVFRALEGARGRRAQTVDVDPARSALKTEEIVALHNHMIGEEPRVVFLHFWGTGPAADLARGLRSALDAQAAVSGAK